IGDIGLNYRYQLVGDGGAPLAVSPRVSLVLPTGDWKRGRGLGAAGVDLNLPVSYVLSRTMVTHFNAGFALTPSARNAAGDRATFSEFSIGQSLILTAHPNVQPMLEIAYAIGNDVIGESRTARTEALLISPGVRAAFNLASGLQIVPGVAVPIGAGPSSGDRGVFVYLSFEHAFRQ
ncbi:MAG: transporter, partial [Gemmatimonadota bacterium]|nr:transporter [Gemmatimonadota bacterium]